MTPDPPENAIVVVEQRLVGYRGVQQFVVGSVEAEAAVDALALRRHLAPYIATLPRYFHCY